MKIQGRDVLATWKVLVSLAVVPLLYLFYILLVTFLMYRYDLAPAIRHWTPVFMIAILPSLGYSALKFGEAGMDVAKYLGMPLRLRPADISSGRFDLCS